MNIDLLPGDYLADQAENERAIEIPLAVRWLADRDPANVVEVGNVLAGYTDVAHTVVDQFDEEAAVQVDAETFDFRGRDVVSISTVEHFGRLEYGNEDHDPEKPGRFIRKLLAEARAVLVSYPLGFNEELDAWTRANADRIRWFGYRKITHDPPKWKRTGELAGEYDRPFPKGNAVVFITGGK